MEQIWNEMYQVAKKVQNDRIISDLIEQCKADAIKAGFDSLYLCTDHIGYYEHYGFEYIGTGYHPWGESSRIYASKLG